MRAHARLIRAQTHKIHHTIAATRQIEASKFLASLSSRAEGVRYLMALLLGPPVEVKGLRNHSRVFLRQNQSALPFISTWEAY
jgi:hypothetical protein